MSSRVLLAIFLLFPAFASVYASDSAASLNKPIVTALVEHLQSEGCEFGIRVPALKNQYILYGHPADMLYMRINGKEKLLKLENSSGIGVGTVPRVDSFSFEGGTVELVMTNSRSCPGDQKECDYNAWDTVVTVRTNQGKEVIRGVAHVSC